MKTYANTIFLLIALFTTNTSLADGNSLLTQCSVAIRFIDTGEAGNDLNDLLGMGNCLGMMQGVTGLNIIYEVMLEKEALFCMPKTGIQNGQAARIVVKYLKNHPEKLHQKEIFLIVAAFQEAFTCD